MTRNTILKAIISTAVLALSASAAQFKVNMPVESQWGKVTLPAGEYMVTTEANSPELTLSGNGKTASVLIASNGRANDSAHSAVTIKNVNGHHVVTQLVSNTTGRVYDFIAAK